MFQQIFSRDKVFRGIQRTNKDFMWPISQLAFYKYTRLHPKPFHLVEMSSIKQLMPRDPDQTLSKAILVCGRNGVEGINKLKTHQPTTVTL